jgi:2'-5' RNA ligase
MHFVAQLDVDAATNNRLDDLAEQLDQNSGLETVRRIGDVHHVSLGVYDDLPAERFSADLAQFAPSLHPLPIRLSNVGIFPGPRSVLYLGPVVTEDLLALHWRFHAAFGEFAPACWGHYLPGAWVPHVTLAMDVEPPALQVALEVMRAHWEPGAVAARLDAIRFIRFRPVETLSHRVLSYVAGGAS